MKLKAAIIIILLSLFGSPDSSAQINTEQVMRIGRNTLYFEDYVLSIQYFNQVINAKPHLAQPYFYRAIAKLNLEDYRGAEEDATLAIERNPFITDAYEVRGVARQNLGKDSLAVADYDMALADMPVNRGVMYNKALAQSDMKDYSGAEATFEALIDAFPGFDSGYLGRARLRLEQGDTIAASADIDHALKINRNAVNAYLLRADIAMKSTRDYPAALADMNEAIRLQPRMAGLFINRAFLRYMTDDYFGAMADYDYALQLEPDNTVALFNRGLLRSEVHDINKAIDDFTRVLRIDPNEYKALYNRAMLLSETGDFDAALADLNRVIAAYPDFAAAYFVRFDIKRRKGDSSAQKDYDRSITLAKSDSVTLTPEAGNNDDNNRTTKTETQDQVKHRFESLALVDDTSEPDKVYNNRNIRGKVQDHTFAIEMEPVFAVTFYTSPTELKQNGDHIKEADDINATRTLRYILQVTNHIPALTDEDVIRAHFNSIDYYTSYLSTHTPRAIDYFGRAMDFITIRNYKAAIDDLDRAIAMSPDFTLAYLVRADARYNDMRLTASDTDSDHTAGNSTLIAKETAATMSAIIDDLNTVIKLSPEMAIAFYNKGVILAEMQDFTSALSAFNHAIELKPDFGEAFYNRGYVFLRLGNRDSGTADLSKAGELGIVPSYNLLKRMSR